jgi:energy-coupling factor transporter ATP-binding protein EcfA2
METSFYALCVMAVAAQITPLLFSVLKIVCLLILSFFNIHFITISTTINKETTNRVMKHLTASKLLWSMNKEIDGSNIKPGNGLIIDIENMVIGWIVLNISSTQFGTETSTTIYLLCSIANRTRLIKPIESEETNKQPKIEANIATQFGNPWNKQFHEIQISQESFITTPSQNNIVINISEQIHLGGCYLIYGPPGTGKSNIINMVAQRISKNNNCKPVIIKGYNFTNPGSFIQEVLSKYTPSKETPVLLSLDELCDIIRKIEKGIDQPEHFTVEVISKDMLAPYFDYIAKIDYLIVIATSNETIEWWNDLNRAYITRPGRFVEKFLLKPLSSQDVKACFNEGKKIYKQPDLILPKDLLTNKLITIATLSNAFKRCGGKNEKFKKLLTRVN